jgi:uncharacterized pyridoxal phosphate-containing UPF0001 family protein
VPVQDVAERDDQQDPGRVADLGGGDQPAGVRGRRTEVLRDEVEQRLGRELPILSMGMSDDFEDAVREGSTMLRLGRVLFGERTL